MPGALREPDARQALSWPWSSGVQGALGRLLAHPPAAQDSCPSCRAARWSPPPLPLRQWHPQCCRCRNLPGLNTLSSLSLSLRPGSLPSLRLGAGASRREGCKRHGTDDPKPTHRAPSADPQPVRPASTAMALRPQASSSIKTIHPTQASLTTHLHRQQASCPWRRHSVKSLTREGLSKELNSHHITRTSPSTLHARKPLPVALAFTSPELPGHRGGVWDRERTTT